MTTSGPALKRPLIDSDPPDLPPVIVKLEGEGDKTFRRVTIPETKQIAECVSNLIGKVKSLRVARGGDLFVHVFTPDQAATLLQTTKLGSKSVKTSEPNQKNRFVGVIYTPLSYEKRIS